MHQNSIKGLHIGVPSFIATGVEVLVRRPCRAARGCRWTWSCPAGSGLDLRSPPNAPRLRQNEGRECYGRSNAGYRKTDRRPLSPLNHRRPPAAAKSGPLGWWVLQAQAIGDALQFAALYFVFQNELYKVLHQTHRMRDLSVQPSRKINLATDIVIRDANKR